MGRWREREEEFAILPLYLKFLSTPLLLCDVPVFKTIVSIIFIKVMGVQKALFKLT